ncbi:CHAT domain-containing protein [Micromonospora zamorensis]|uniref:CHAT domain-containing protein n=1 Tax=Micromonospora zamorensis TaxID=709883 RepID=UPI0033D4B792
MAVRVGVDDEERAGAYANLAVLLIRRFERTQDYGDLRAAVRAGRAGVAADPRSGPTRAMCLINLAAALQTSFDATGDPASLAEGIDATRSALPDWPDRGPTSDRIVTGLAKALYEHVQATGRMVDSVQDVVDARRAVAATPVTDPQHPTMSGYLCALLFARHAETNDAADLTEAMSIGEAVLGWAPSDALMRHAQTLRHRYELDGDPEFLERSVAVALDAVDRAPPAGHSRRSALEVLAYSLETVYVYATPAGDHDSLIALCQWVSTTDSVDADTKARALSGMSQAFWMRARRTGSRADLNAAVDRGAQAVATAQGGSAYERALDSLVNALLNRAQLTGRASDAESAVGFAQLLTGQSSSAEEWQGAALANAASVLQVLYSQTGRLSTLSEAIATYQRSVVLLGDNDERAGALSNTAAAFRTRFNRMGNTDDLDEAVRCGRLAMEALPHGGRHRGAVLGNLATTLELVARRGPNLAVLDEAIELHGAAIAATAADDENRSGRLSGLADALAARFRYTASPDDLTAATATYGEAMTVRGASPATKASAARAMGMLAARHQRWDTAVDGLSTALGLLPQIVWLGIDRADRADRLAAWHETGSAAAAVALAAGRPETAIELLEQGRSVLWNQDLRLREEHEALASEAPHLHATLTALAGRLDEATADIAGQRPEVAAQWDAAVEAVRQLPGFENFLRPPTAQALQRHLGPHPVVVVNVHPLRSDAVVLTGESTTSIALPDLTYEDLSARIESYLIAATRLDLGQTTRLDHVNANQTLMAILEWLWDVLAEPVLLALGHHGPPAAGGALPGLIWCPVGILSLLPLHAAGYQNDPGNAVLDRVVSSYTSSVLALTRGNRIRAGNSRQLLVVSVPDPAVGELVGLPGARAEAAMLATEFPDQISDTLIDGAATRDAVTERLPRSGGVHFACHGSQHLDAPHTGAIHLSDGAFTVTDFAALRLEHAEFAYLSACKTAVGGTELPDEAIHLVAALQLTGYRSVIGTLWTIDDQLAVEMARRTYELMRGPHGHFDFSASATALHRATRELRDAYPYEAARWAPYVHFGPCSPGEAGHLGLQRR